MYGTVVRLSMYDTQRQESYTDDLNTVPYIGDDSTHYKLFCTTAWPDDGPVRPKTYSSVKLIKL
jgi:hypothetical protein